MKKYKNKVSYATETLITCTAHNHLPVWDDFPTSSTCFHTSLGGDITVSTKETGMRLARLCEVAVGTQQEANGHLFPLSHFTLQPLPSPPQREGQQIGMGLKSPGELGKDEC